MSHETNTAPPCSRLLRLGGQVQGVGFRPFVFRTATAAGLTGWVENRGAEVRLLLQGTPEKIDAALHTLLHDHPPLARPRLIEQSPVEHRLCGDFQIRSSRKDEGEQPHIPPDYFVCDECLAEFHDPANRRYHYPFINCTQCGPRYTLIDHLPYDRASTTMAGFPLCAACHAEYTDPHDRRFHAEPIACPECGPRLRFHREGMQLEESAATLEAAVALLAQGRILALKGIGGYHLLCDARDEQAVQRLRQRKNRPDKPLAVMFPQHGSDGLALLEQVVAPTSAEAQLLRSPLRPIVLCRKRPDDTLARGIAPGLDEIGAMLPYSPLHHLLCDAFAAPLVATSGNISGEPVITDEDEAQRRLGGIADGFVHHNRPIRRPADDPLYRTIGGRPRPLRLGRGNAPRELELPFTLEQPLLAVGGEMKNAVALAWEDRLVLSPHIGELHSPRGVRIFAQVIADLQQLYGVTARAVVHDAHPDYHASRWARQSGLTTQAVLHHHAHASALYAEHWPAELETPWLVATWDGVGYGDDGTLWGGECLLGRPGEWQRFARFRPFRLPGGDKAGREPWRSALALALESDQPWAEPPAEAELLSEAWRRGLNSPQTSAAGRLFDAAAALLGVCHRASYEGQAPMLLEALAGDSREQIELPLTSSEEGLWQSDWAPLLPLLLDGQLPPADRAARFHHSLAAALCAQAQKAREQHGITTVGLAGGVFQNRYLVESLIRQLDAQGFSVRLAEKVPCNDGGLAWGQIIEAACRTHRPAVSMEG
ncbi:MAG: carbamoyltransferase HypF [Gammaproteobacteria bacterium]|nr:carbamoyltransferase HypF [Gammaproteobacteria bacterium]